MNRLYLILAAIFLIILAAIFFVWRLKKRRIKNNDLFKEMSFGGTQKSFLSNFFSSLISRDKKKIFGNNSKASKKDGFSPDNINILGKQKLPEKDKSPQQKTYEKPKTTTITSIKKGGEILQATNEPNKIGEAISKKWKYKKRRSISKKEDQFQNKSITFQELLQKIKGTELAQILGSLNEEDSATIIKRLSIRNFDSKSEFFGSLTSELTNLLETAYQEIKVRLSQLRKGGRGVATFGIRAMSIPLKINIFNATSSKKDFDRVWLLIKDIDKEIKKYESSGISDYAG